MNDLKYSLFIFLGACSYGILASIVKIALSTGLPVYQVTGSQYFLGFVVLLAASPFIKEKENIFQTGFSTEKAFHTRNAPTFY